MSVLIVISFPVFLRRLRPLFEQRLYQTAIPAKLSAYWQGSHPQCPAGVLFWQKFPAPSRPQQPLRRIADQGTALPYLRRKPGVFGPTLPRNAWHRPAEARNIRRILPRNGWHRPAGSTKKARSSRALCTGRAGHTFIYSH